jgi:hypothetical protein
LQGVLVVVDDAGIPGCVLQIVLEQLQFRRRQRLRR